MVETSIRLFKMLALLQSRRFWAGSALAQELGVTERSVRRDMERLRSLGYPVHATAGVGGGYQLGAGKELPPLPLEDDEAVAVALGLRAAASGPVKGMEEASVRALAKLEQVLPKRLRNRVNALHEVSVRIGGGGARIDAEVLSLLAHACRDSQLLTFGYKSREGEDSERNAEPYRLVHNAYRWYLLAYDLGRKDWRTFRVDRIGAKPRVGQRFKPRPLPNEDVAAYISDSAASAPYRFKAKLTIHAPANKLRERLSPLGGRIEELDEERCLVHTGAHTLDGLAFHLGFLGFEFRVHEPKELIDHLRAFSARLRRAATASS